MSPCPVDLCDPTEMLCWGICFSFIKSGPGNDFPDSKVTFKKKLKEVTFEYIYIYLTRKKSRNKCVEKDGPSRNMFPVSNTAILNYHHVTRMYIPVKRVTQNLISTHVHAFQV